MQSKNFNKYNMAVHKNTQPHIYTHIHKKVALIIEISFVLGLGKFTLNCYSPRPTTSNINKLPRMNIVSHYQTTYIEKSKNSFQAEADEPLRICKPSDTNPGAFLWDFYVAR